LPGQVSQALPPPPQELVASPGRHVPAPQHPPGHEVPSHTQMLPMHRCPEVQGAPAPHLQAPCAEQLSERSSHTAQVVPASPQACTERVAHVRP